MESSSGRGTLSVSSRGEDRLEPEDLHGSSWVVSFDPTPKVLSR